MSALPPRRRGLRSSPRSPFRLSRTNEGLVGLDDPGKPVRRLPNRLQEAVTPAMRRARRNPAALGRRLYRLAFGKRRAEAQPALLVVPPRQRRAGERAECFPAGLAPVAPQDRAPCPATPHRRFRSAGSAARHPRPVRSPPARRRPSAGSTESLQPPFAAPPSTHRHTKTSPETASHPSTGSPTQIGNHSTIEPTNHELSLGKWGVGRSAVAIEACRTPGPRPNSLNPSKLTSG